MGGSAGDTIRISIEDDSSRVQFVECDVTPHDFAMAVFGRGNVPASFETAGLNLIGTKAENKTELVPFDAHKYQRERSAFEGDDVEARTPAVLAALKSFEVDGWRASVSDMWNSHRREKGGQRVTFFRHVRADGTPVL